MVKLTNNIDLHKTAIFLTLLPLFDLLKPNSSEHIAADKSPYFYGTTKKTITTQQNETKKATSKTFYFKREKKPTTSVVKM